MLLDIKKPGVSSNSVIVWLALYPGCRNKDHSNVSIFINVLCTVIMIREVY